MSTKRCPHIGLAAAFFAVLLSVSGGRSAIAAVPSATSTPSSPSDALCPSGARYDFPTKRCKCTAGFITVDARCLPGATGCISEHGPYSRYDDAKQACTCLPGYAWNAKKTECIDRTIACRAQLGEDAYYDIPASSCVCGAGSVYDTVLLRCVTGTLWCVSRYGSLATYDALMRQCACMPGHLFDPSRNGCVEDLPVPPSTDADAQPATGTADLPDSPPRPEKQVTPICPPGTALGLGKKRCIAIPEHSHAAIGSKTELWRCDDGYEESGEACLLQASTSVPETPPVPVAPSIPSRQEKKTWFQALVGWFKALF